MFMIKKPLIYILSSIQLLGIGYGLYLIRSADTAMNKSGIGNFELWNEYNSEAGVVISISVVLWVVALILVLATKQHRNLLGQAAIFIPPSAFFIGWAALWYI
jgi:hypothetical protein